MKFIDIRAELIKKQKILQNTKVHLESVGKKLIEDLEELRDNLDCVDNMIIELDKLTKAAE